MEVGVGVGDALFPEKKAANWWSWFIVMLIGLEVPKYVPSRYQPLKVHPEFGVAVMVAFELEPYAKVPAPGAVVPGPFDETVR